jgi:hypothetical protein
MIYYVKDTCVEEVILAQRYSQMYELVTVVRDGSATAEGH